MYQLDEKTMNRIYAGWLGKIIGIRLGAPVEGWTYEKINSVYGEIWDYPVDYRDFAADDDSNGPVFLVRALELSQKKEAVRAQDIAETLLNYAPYEHAFFWWGGYGISTEHTAYLNLKNGIKAPESGSIRMNGATIAEQIGGQIFIDCWGLVTPGNPDLAARLAKEAASVTHDGNGIWGGVFIAVCISLAFEDHSITEMIKEALMYIPADCEYARVVNSVMDFWQKNETSSWQDCYDYVYANFGYDKYPGECHIIPNAALIILSLLYGEDDYTKSICICNMCGWDTDCNAGNVGTIMGVRRGLAGIPYEKWRKPVNDLLIGSSTMGSLNIMDIPYGASYMAKQAFLLAEQKLPKNWQDIMENRIESCHFEYPGSTHAMRVRCEEHTDARHLQLCLRNSDEQAYTGTRSLKLYAKSLDSGQKLYLYQKTYYCQEDLHDDRYAPSFSPVIYPGQTLSGSVFLPESQPAAVIQMYVHELHSKQVITGPKRLCKAGQWERLDFAIPGMEGALLDEAGFLFTIPTDAPKGTEFMAYVDDMEYFGKPDYSIDFNRETKEKRTPLHYEITQFTKVKGWTWLEDGWMHLIAADFAQTFTGSHRFDDYELTARIRPLAGDQHYLNVRVQGAIRSYEVGFHGKGKLALLKNSNDIHELAVIDYLWEEGQEYTISVRVSGNCIKVLDENMELLTYCDTEQPYLSGAVGLSARGGSHSSFTAVRVREL